MQRSTSSRAGQNVTITLPPDVLTEAKHMAVDEGLPLSHFIADLVRAKVGGTRRFREARRQELTRMRHGTGFELGPIIWTRDELHRR